MYVFCKLPVIKFVVKFGNSITILFTVLKVLDATPLLYNAKGILQIVIMIQYVLKVFFEIHVPLERTIYALRNRNR